MCTLRWICCHCRGFMLEETLDLRSGTTFWWAPGNAHAQTSLWTGREAAVHGPTKLLALHRLPESLLPHLGNTPFPHWRRVCVFTLEASKEQRKPCHWSGTIIRRIFGPPWALKNSEPCKSAPASPRMTLKTQGSVLEEPQLGTPSLGCCCKRRRD